MLVFNVHRGSELFLGAANRAFFPPLLPAYVLLVQVLFSLLVPSLILCRHFFFFNPECMPQAFSIPLSQVIANDRTHRQRQDGYRQDHPQREEHKDSSDLVSSILQVCQLIC